MGRRHWMAFPFLLCFITLGLHGHWVYGRRTWLLWVTQWSPLCELGFNLMATISPGRKFASYYISTYHQRVDIFYMGVSFPFFFFFKFFLLVQSLKSADKGWGIGATWQTYRCSQSYLIKMLKIISLSEGLYKLGKRWWNVARLVPHFYLLTIYQYHFLIEGLVNRALNILNCRVISYQ